MCACDRSVNTHARTNHTNRAANDVFVVWSCKSCRTAVICCVVYCVNQKHTTRAHTHANDDHDSQSLHAHIVRYASSIRSALIRRRWSRLVNEQQQSEAKPTVRPFARRTRPPPPQRRLNDKDAVLCIHSTCGRVRRRRRTYAECI